MQQQNSKSLIILAFASFLSSTTQAQQNSSAPQQGILIQGRVTQRIVDECEVDEAGTRCRQLTGDIIPKPITLQVPDFKPGDQDTHVYVISRIGDHSTGGGSAKADEHGIVRDQQLIRTNAPDEELQFYLTSMDINTLEARVSLDLYDVKLRQFLTSLQSAVDMAYRQATKTRFMSRRRPPVVHGDDQKFADMRLSIQGDNLTVEEVLDELYVNTGCFVDQTPEGLAVASCR